MYIDSGSPIVTECTFIDNRPSGIDSADSTLQIDDCTFVGGLRILFLYSLRENGEGKMSNRVSMLLKVFRIELEDSEDDVIGLLEYYSKRFEDHEITPYVWRENQAL